jgi:polysaccharide biosynthesis/export protein
MARKCGGRLSQALWTVLLVGLGSLGCQAQVSFLSSTPLPPVAHASGDQPAARAPAPDGPTVVKVNQDIGVHQVVHHQAAEPQAAQSVGPPSQASDKPVVDKVSPEPAPNHGGTPVSVLPDVGATPLVQQETAIAVGPRLPLPSEKAKTFMPAYVIEPPDVLLIDGIRLIPKPPYRVEPLDVLLISVPNALPDQPIGGPYTVTPEGTINLGFGYGSFRVVGLTLEQAAAAIKGGLRINNPLVNVALAQFRGVQMVRGEHIVGQDGTITLGTYGCVNVTGLTLSQAKCEIERHLSRSLQDPIVSVSIAGYNSKVYYVITDGAGFGQQVYRFPITGNETVLDAISMINGLPPVANKRSMWLARPTPAQHGCYQVLPINWEAITEAGATETNWQLFPGDRVYVKADPFITFDNQISKVLSPVERLLGAALLGRGVFSNSNGTNGGF